jgi:hypothetical protein
MPVYGVETGKFIFAGTLNNVLNASNSVVIAFTNVQGYIYVNFSGIAINNAASFRLELINLLNQFPGYGAVVNIVDNGATWSVSGYSFHPLTVESYIPLKMWVETYPIPQAGFSTSYIPFGREHEFIELCTCAPVPVPVVCDTCNEVTMQACQPSYFFTAGLSGNTIYYIQIQDRMDTVYTQQITTDANGDFTIIANDIAFPEGFWTPENTPIEVTVFSDADYLVQVDINANATIYGCINLNFEYIVTTTSSFIPTFSHLIDDNGSFIIDSNNNTFIVG